MPRYYFDVMNAGGVTRDEVGLDLLDDVTARQHVMRLVADLARLGLPDGDLHTFGCTARNETGMSVYLGSITYQGTRL